MPVMEGPGFFRKIYAILEIPWVYRLAGWLLAPGAPQGLAPLMEKAFGKSRGLVLDMGCGPELNTPEPEGLLVGADVIEKYVRSYTGGYLDEDPGLVSCPPPGRKRLGYLLSAGNLPFQSGSFDEARCVAVFHHLTDLEAGKALREMNRCLRSGGRLVIMDAVLPRRAWLRPLAWLTLKLDRGRHVRKQDQLQNLCQEACPGDWQWERRTYTYTGMEFLYLYCLKA